MPDMSDRNCGCNDLLEQYKLYVEMADRVSDRRERTNRFYISLLSALMALIPILQSREMLSPVLLALLAALGMALCFIWYRNLESYRRLNSAKFAVIHEMEKRLPCQCYSREWEMLKRKGYRRLTEVEQRIPLLTGVIFLLLFLVSLYLIIQRV
ncbi:MAG: hypothetical protein GXO29_06720 [Thermotogae bacterium]|nr:hypothetical protein [Thermotogota bacterium]